MGVKVNLTIPLSSVYDFTNSAKSNTQTYFLNQKSFSSFANVFQGLPTELVLFLLNAKETDTRRLPSERLAKDLT